MFYGNYLESYEQFQKVISDLYEEISIAEESEDFLTCHLIAREIAELEEEFERVPPKDCQRKDTTDHRLKTNQQEEKNHG